MAIIEKFVRCGQHRLAEVLHLPSLKTTTCVVTCHGFHSNKDGSKYLDIAHSFCGEGLAVFRFDFRGCGESKGNLTEATLTGESKT